MRVEAVEAKPLPLVESKPAAPEKTPAVVCSECGEATDDGDETCFACRSQE